jgi:hypothetical protein
VTPGTAFTGFGGNVSGGVFPWGNDGTIYADPRCPNPYTPFPVGQPACCGTWPEDSNGRLTTPCAGVENTVCQGQDPVGGQGTVCQALRSTNEPNNYTGPGLLNTTILGESCARVDLQYSSGMWNDVPCEWTNPFVYAHAALRWLPHQLTRTQPWPLHQPCPPPSQCASSAYAHPAGVNCLSIIHGEQYSQSGNARHESNERNPTASATSSRLTPAGRMPHGTAPMPPAVRTASTSREFCRIMTRC